MRFALVLATFVLPLISALPQGSIHVFPTGSLQLGLTPVASNGTVSIAGSEVAKSVGIGAKVFGFWKNFVNNECFNNQTCRKRGVKGLQEGKNKAKGVTAITSVAQKTQVTSTRVNKVKATSTKVNKVKATSTKSATKTTSIQVNRAKAQIKATSRPQRKRPLRLPAVSPSDDLLDGPSTFSDPASTSTPSTPKVKATPTPDPVPEPEPETTSNVRAVSSPSPAPEPETESVSGGGDSGLSQFAQDALSSHNSFRAQYGAKPLTWDTELEAAAKKWADRCVFEHGGGVAGGFGENIAAGQEDIKTVVKQWGPDEAPDYNPDNVVASHFTQVVWKATTKVGCAVTQCSSLAIFGGGAAPFYVCEYDPAGNVFPASNFLTNVGTFQG